MTGYDVEAGTPLPLANRLDVTLTNVAAVRVDGAAARLSDRKPLVLRITSDGRAVLRLTGLPGLSGARGVRVHSGTTTLTLRPGR